PMQAKPDDKQPSGSRGAVRIYAFPGDAEAEPEARHLAAALRQRGLVVLDGDAREGDPSIAAVIDLGGGSWLDQVGSGGPEVPTLVLAGQPPHRMRRSLVHALRAHPKLILGLKDAAHHRFMAFLLAGRPEEAGRLFTCPPGLPEPQSLPADADRPIAVLMTRDLPGGRLPVHIRDSWRDHDAGSRRLLGDILDEARVNPAKPLEDIAVEVAQTLVHDIGTGRLLDLAARVAEVLEAEAVLAAFKALSRRPDAVVIGGGWPGLAGPDTRARLTGALPRASRLAFYARSKTALFPHAGQHGPARDVALSLSVGCFPLASDHGFYEDAFDDGIDRVPHPDLFGLILDGRLADGDLAERARATLVKALPRHGWAVRAAEMMAVLAG
ncbi:MAG: hypothetical protein ACPGNT_07725, partial [Rhodospirillales bacterium]